MIAAIITIGTELTDGRIVDTNSGFIAARLERLGLRVAMALTLPDEERAIGEGLAYALERQAALVIISGGLGPTIDDITATAIARALELEIAIDPEAEQMVADAVGRDPADLAPHQYKQAELPVGSMSLKPAGTAPGFVVMAGDIPVVCLPGVPRELTEMWDYALAVPAIATIIGAVDAPARRSLCFYGSGEPAVSAAVESFLGTELEGIEVSICARYQEVVLEIVFPPAASSRVDKLMVSLKQRFGWDVFSEGERIEEALGAELLSRGRMLAVAESCTGGMLGETLTGISGSSGFFQGGVIAYANEIKTDLLGVSAETLETDGAVSEAVAGQLATGVMHTCTADYGIGITGIAGPGGGTTEKPVGLVYIGIAAATAGAVRRFDFRGGREDVRRSAVTAALHMLHRHLLEEDAEA
ncbi:MAG: CinA family nicotinamide mononucleotide deamidase-related protein [Thermoleophilia bacterium]|nr:CinA family nicotinamide mononucleotide deamidase-related protein [Thermoleophilia bacterium]